jgi:drug/metabolite transporter (DMT)-like permease
MNADKDRSDLTGQFQIWGATILIATSFPVGQAIAQGLDPAVLTFLRFVIAAAMFAPIIAWRYGLKWPGWRAMTGYAGISLCMTGFFWAMFEALRYTTALNTGTIFVLIPSLAAVYSFFLLGDRLGRYKLTALALGIIGAVWTIFRGDLDRVLGLQFNRGDLIFLAGCFLMAGYGPLVKKLHRQEPPAVISFWSVVTGCVWLALFANVKLFETDWTAISTNVWTGVIYLAVFTTILSTFLFQAAAIKLGPNRVAAFYYLNPLFVLVIDFVVGKGLPPLRILPGVAIALAATFVLARAVRQKPATP